MSDQFEVSPEPTLGQVLSDKLRAAKDKVESAKVEMGDIELEIATIPDSLKVMVYEDVVKKVEGWFKG